MSTRRSDTVGRKPTGFKVWDRFEDPAVGVEYLGFAYVPCGVTVREQVDFGVHETARCDGAVQGLEQGGFGSHKQAQPPWCLVVAESKSVARKIAIDR